MIRFGRYCPVCGTTLPLSSPAVLFASGGSLALVSGILVVLYFQVEEHRDAPSWVYWLFGMLVIASYFGLRWVRARERDKDWSKECQRCQFMDAVMRSKGRPPEEERTAER